MPTCELNEATIHYQERGSGPAFVYCHGLGGSGEGFERDDVDWYAEHFRTVSWDNVAWGGPARRPSTRCRVTPLTSMGCSTTSASSARS